MNIDENKRYEIRLAFAASAPYRRTVMANQRIGNEII